MRQKTDCSGGCFDNIFQEVEKMTSFDELPRPKPDSHVSYQFYPPYLGVYRVPATFLYKVPILGGTL